MKLTSGCPHSEGKECKDSGTDWHARVDMYTDNNKWVEAKVNLGVNKKLCKNSTIKSFF